MPASRPAERPASTPGSDPEAVPRSASGAAPDPVPARRRVLDRIPRGLWIRVLLYGLVGHVFAAFLILLFELGARQ
ncbi:DUF6126 family protein [Streptomyces sp. DSM 44917]|uniref:DUF6126 family protein n=1 Tax=Streptomyces boetiae TaxID=3075541 RepID=A0ABU2L2V2_9ACTN|nr:DUF6126 family protein [Streptomyces sp. DSM 44917]MDT0305884.1 DUF6126 family protein [Streptomyces sp. DSM 44917]